MPKYESTVHSFDSIAVFLQDSYRFCEVLFLDQDVVRVIGRDSKNPDLVFGEDRRKFGQDADEREIQRALDAESPPAIFARRRLRWRVLGLADQREFFVRLGEEKEV